MARGQRSGFLRTARSVKQQAADTLSLPEYGLLNRIWDDLRWTPSQVRVNNCVFDLKAGQAVISMAGYAEQFRCRQSLVASALKKLEADGWFDVERSRKGTVVTCLRDPRGDPEPVEGEVLHRGKNLVHPLATNPIIRMFPVVRRTVVHRRTTARGLLLRPCLPRKLRARALEL